MLACHATLAVVCARGAVHSDDIYMTENADNGKMTRCHEINSHEINLSRDQLNFFNVLLDKSINGTNTKSLEVFLN